MNRRRGAAVGAVAVLLALLTFNWIDTPRTGGETPVLVKGTRTAIHCLKTGTLLRCGTTAEERRKADVGRFEMASLESVVGPFALLGYPPAALLVGAGLSNSQIFDVLALLSVAAFLAMLAVLWAMAKRAGRPEWGAGLALVCLAGPLIYYANGSGVEVISAFVMVLFLAALIFEAPWWMIAGAAVLAGISKETAPPFLAALGVITVLGLRLEGRGRLARKQAAAAVGGLVLAVAVNLLFNVFRYGGISNLDYAQGTYGQPRPPLGERAELFGGLLFAPNGGILPFWPLAALLLGAVAVLALIGLRGQPRRKAWLGLALIGAFLLLTAGLASWRGPFGWWAWGPRLTLPWVPVFAIVAVVLYGEELARGVRSLTRSVPALLATGLVVTLFAAPHVGVLWQRDVAWRFFLAGQDPVCQSLDPADTARYYACMEHRAWVSKPVLVDALRGLGTAGGALTAVAFFAACVSLLGLMRDPRAHATGPREPVVGREPAGSAAAQRG